MIGLTISHYKILDKLGEGGMGVVYKAEDVKLGRTVGLKFLRFEGIHDAERKGRFLHEARAAAALDHPNICTVYEIDEVDGQLFMAMPFLAGRTLEQHITEGPLPIGEAVEIALQLADALGEAHAKGIVHRDVKPSNVMLIEREDKPIQVKLMDFGLARLSEATRLTREGVQPGTVQYMSPEQISGEKIDHRTDIWSLGVVLYEMIAGRPPFEGAYEQALYYGILNEAPEALTALRTGVPLSLERLVFKCLAKGRGSRYQSCSEIQVDLKAVEGFAFRAATAVVAPTQHQREGDDPAKRRAGSPYAPIRLAAPLVLAAAMLSYLAGRRATTHTSEDLSTRAHPTHLQMTLPGEAPLAFDALPASTSIEGSLFDISPDGRRLAYVGVAEGGGTLLFLREMDRVEVTPVFGSEGAIHPFFSPDGQTIGFLTDDKVKRISIGGGTAVTLCEAVKPILASWTTGGLIYFSDNEGMGLSRVRSDGGVPERVLSYGKERREYGRVLPDGQSVFATLIVGSISRDYANIQVISLETGDAKTLRPRGFDARYVAPGFLVFGHGGELYAAEFDLENLELRSEPQRLASNVRMNSLLPYVQAAFSQSGVVVYAPGGDAAVGRPAWVDRQGRTQYFPLEEKVYGALDLSTDGRRVAVQVADVSDYIQIYDVDTGISQKVTGPANVGFPSWSRDGRSLVFAQQSSDGEFSLVMQSLGSDSRPMVLNKSEMAPLAGNWSRDGRRFAFAFWPPDSVKIVEAPHEGGPPVVSIVAEKAGLLPDLAPNGEWIAWVDGDEIRVSSVDWKRVHQISPAGGTDPRWRQQGEELFFRRGDQFFSSRVQFDPEFTWSNPQIAFETNLIVTPGFSYDISPDGKQILVVKRERLLPRDEIHVIQNWTQLLETKQ